MCAPHIDVVCAGHICLDMTPELAGRAEELFSPGKLSVAGPLCLSTGGSVANTGLSLIKLGVSTALMAKIGDDALGRMTGQVLVENGGSDMHLSVDPSCASAYTVVLAPPGSDRMFLHQPAANDLFSMSDIDFSVVERAKIFHFGYPTLMAGIARDGGAELQRIFREVKRLGVKTSLDVSFPFDRGIDWARVLHNVLPLTDMFFPSIEELLMMMEPQEYARLKALDEDILKVFSLGELPRLGRMLMGIGPQTVAIKCGATGFYARAEAEVFSGVYAVPEVKSATGAGDASIAGFLAAQLAGGTIFDAVNAACAAGALCVTDFSATGALMPLEAARAYADRMFKKQRPANIEGFAWHEEHAMLVAV